jgi:hypothetical protein
MKVSFDIGPRNRALVDLIVERAKAEGLIFERYSEETCRMDLVATNANGCPMAFRRLLDADDFTFVHDIAGIARHMDRETGKLRGFFRPRCTRRYSAGPLFREQRRAS